MAGQDLTLQIGPSFSTLKWENSMIEAEMYEDNLTGINVLMGIQYLDLKYFNLHSNIGFVQKGGKDSIPLVNVEGEILEIKLFKYRLDYLTLNTTANLKLPVKDIFVPYLFAGPRIDYLVSYKEDVVFLEQFDEMDALNKFTYGLVTGAGFDFQIQQFLIGTVFSYYFNFNKIVDWTTETEISNIPEVTNTVDDKTFTINLKVGYRL
jgi:hypothetical protein